MMPGIAVTPLQEQADVSSRSDPNSPSKTADVPDQSLLPRRRAKDMLDHVLGAFFITKEQGKGTGPPS
jgi:hypothetical protein